MGRPARWHARWHCSKTHPMLAVLDGINTACGNHGWDVEKNNAVGRYRAMFVTPLTDRHHRAVPRPPSESDEATNRVLQLRGSRLAQRRRRRRLPHDCRLHTDRQGQERRSALHSVKDRYGEVERWGEQQEGEGTPWYYMGQFVVDNTPMADLTGNAQTVCHSHRASQERRRWRQRQNRLPGRRNTSAYLREATGKFHTFNCARHRLAGHDLKFSKSDLPVALQKLVNRGLLEWPEVEGNKKRPGWLIVDESMKSSTSANCPKWPVLAVHPMGVCTAVPVHNPACTSTYRTRSWVSGQRQAGSA